MQHDVTLWRLELALPGAAQAEAFATALDGMADSCAWFADGDADDPAVGWKVEALFRAAPDHAAVGVALALAAAAQGAVAPEPHYDRLPARDWVTANLASFPPVDAGGFHIRGSHIVAPRLAGRVTLVIDAGTAFGSGEHATTRGCLLALDRLLRRRRFRRPLDLGCGSGILALALARRTGAKVLASDIDPVAVRVTLANARRNGAGRLIRAVTADGLTHRALRGGRPYDLIFANILARPLAAMAADLAISLTAGGIAILAGLLARQERFVLAPYRAAGLALAGRVRVAGWTILILAHGGGRF